MNEPIKPRPTFEQYMLENGMNEPHKLRADFLEQWRVKYNLIHPPELPTDARAEDPKPSQ